MSYTFPRNFRPTLGIEEEFQICDPRTGALVSRVNQIMERAEPTLREHLAYDLIQGLIEVHTGVADSVEEGIADLLAKRREVQGLAEAEGCTLGMTGTHPFADPKAIDLVDTEAYRWVADQLRYVARRNLTFGLHVHVGVDDADRAVYVANRMREWVGLLIALSANSPFLDGLDSGWNSSRCVAFGAFPRAGLPPRLRDWAEYEETIDLLMKASSITKPRQIWWNVRPHPSFGTVEVRAFDVQMSLARTAALVAVVQALVVTYMERHRRGEPEPELPTAFLEDSRFKGMRFGLDADVVAIDSREIIPMREAGRRMLALAAEAAADLGTERHLATLEGILAEGNGASYQRRMAEEHNGDLQAVQIRLLEEARSVGIRDPDLVLSP